MRWHDAAVKETSQATCLEALVATLTVTVAGLVDVMERIDETLVEIQRRTS